MFFAKKIYANLTYVTKDDHIFSGCYLDGSLHIGEIVWSKDNWLWLLDQLQVANSRQFECAILQGIRSLVDNENVQSNVVLIHIDVALRVDGVTETR